MIEPRPSTVPGGGGRSDEAFREKERNVPENAEPPERQHSIKLPLIKWESVGNCFTDREGWQRGHLEEEEREGGRRRGREGGGKGGESGREEQALRRKA